MPLETPRSAMNRAQVEQSNREQVRIAERQAREQEREHARAEFLRARHNGRRCHEAGRKMKWMSSLNKVFERADPHKAGLVTTDTIMHALCTDPDAASLVGLSTSSASAMKPRFDQAFEEVGVGSDHMVDLLQFQNFCVKLNGSDGH